MLVVIPLSAQSPKARYLRDADRMCGATLGDGTAYEVWNRVLVTKRKGQPVYVKVRGYYKPDSGEFLSLTTDGMPKREYVSEPKEASCELPYHHVLLLKDGEWADFWATKGRVGVFHSSLKFETREKAWSYVAKHWQDGRKFVYAEIFLYQQLGSDFFRPKSLEFDARPYTYDSLISVTKVDSNWKLEIRGADEPNSATVLLNGNFRLLTVAKNPVTR